MSRTRRFVVAATLIAGLGILAATPADAAAPDPTEPPTTEPVESSSPPTSDPADTTAPPTTEATEPPPSPTTTVPPTTTAPTTVPPSDPGADTPSASIVFACAEHVPGPAVEWTVTMVNPTPALVDFEVTFMLEGHTLSEPFHVDPGTSPTLQSVALATSPFTISVAITGGLQLASELYTPGDCPAPVPGPEQQWATVTVWCASDGAHVDVTLDNPTNEPLVFTVTRSADGDPNQTQWPVAAGETETIHDVLPVDAPTFSVSISIGSRPPLASATSSPGECSVASTTTEPIDETSTVPSTTDPAPMVTSSHGTAGTGSTHPTSSQLPMTGSTSTRVAIAAAVVLAAGLAMRRLGVSSTRP